MRAAVVGGQTEPVLSCMIVPCPALRLFRLKASVVAKFIVWPATLVTCWMALPWAMLNMIRSPGRIALLMPVIGVPGSTVALEPLSAMESRLFLHVKLLAPGHSESLGKR